MVSPLFYEKLSFSKSLCAELATTVAIDAGYSLIKVLCVDKGETDALLTCAVFRSNQQQEAIQWLTANSNVVGNSKIPITGQMAHSIKECVKEIAKLEPIIVDELASQTKGIQFLIENLQPDELFYRDSAVAAEEPQKFGSFLKKIIKARDDAIKEFGMPKLEGKFPFLYADCGAKLNIMMINNETDIGSPKLFSSLSGLDMFGLGQLLINTMDYDEIMELAMKGDRANVDCVAKEVFSISEDSPYAANPDMPLMNFGKPADHNFANLELEMMNRKDLANSLVHTLASSFYGYAMAAMRLLPRIYVGGNIYKHIYIRNAFRDAGMRFGMSSMPVEFLKYGLVGALGSLIAMKKTD